MRMRIDRLHRFRCSIWRLRGRPGCRCKTDRHLRVVSEPLTKFPLGPLELVIVIAPVLSAGIVSAMMALSTTVAFSRRRTAEGHRKRGSSPCRPLSIRCSAIRPSPSTADMYLHHGKCTPSPPVEEFETQFPYSEPFLAHGATECHHTSLAPSFESDPFQDLMIDGQDRKNHQK
jgi:hypothetical protein